MGESRAWTVATGTATISSTCITGLYAAFSGKRQGNLAFASAFNSGVTAATFFTIREYVVSPTLGTAIGYSRERIGTADEANPTLDQLSWSSLRKHDLLDSGVSGAATGGLLRGITSGRRTIASGALTAGIVCVLLQAAYNELGIQRIKYVGKISQPNINEVPTYAPAKPSLTTRILGTFGVRMLSDEELLVKFRRERDVHLKKIQQLERELEEEHSTKSSNQ
ncbi:hypothetical protein DFH09DRAFT_110519 [Mycena vulgaris]|nr:hypothetical protein DFH09DRAFT_110519 [Mycena vulgaris]